MLPHMTQAMLGPFVRVITGCQTGADRAGYDWAEAHGIDVGGWCPRNRLAEDGRIPDKYLLTEMESEQYPPRTRKNVEESDATLIITNLPYLSRGVLLTKREAYGQGKPYVVAMGPVEKAAETAYGLFSRVHEMNPEGGLVLNIAGPRLSIAFGIEAYVFKVLDVTQELWWQIYGN